MTELVKLLRCELPIFRMVGYDMLWPMFEHCCVKDAASTGKDGNPALQGSSQVTIGVTLSEGMDLWV